LDESNLNNNVGQNNNGVGSIRYVALSDIKSGKVKLPNGSNDENSSIDSSFIQGLPKEQ
jgi:hypothetical protein